MGLIGSGSMRDTKWVAIDAKSFELLTKGLGRKLKVVITERRRGLVSWIRFGEVGLRNLLKGLDMCCRERVPENWGLEWQEDNRSYRLACRTNRAGKFIHCSVKDGEGKRHNVFLPEGKGMVKGWVIIVEKLCKLGVKETREKRIPCYLEGTSKGHLGPTPSYVEAIQRSCNSVVLVDAGALDPK